MLYDDKIYTTHYLALYIYKTNDINVCSVAYLNYQGANITKLQHSVQKNKNFYNHVTITKFFFNLNNFLKYNLWLFI